MLRGGIIDTEHQLILLYPFDTWYCNSYLFKKLPSSMTLEEKNNKNQYSKKHLRSIVDLYRQNKPKILLNNHDIRNDEK